MSGAEPAGALHGDLAQFFPSEVLQLLQLAQATGRLELVRAGEQAELYVERGRPVFARTSGAAVSCGEILVHRGVISAATLERAAHAPGAPAGEGIGAALVAAGAASREEVQAAVNESLRRVLFGLLLWREGSFRFLAGERAPAGDGRLDLDLDRLILEGLRQADEARAV